MENINEMEDIRKQIGELKARLERESTLNEQLLHDSLKMKMNTVHALVRKVISLGIVGVAAWIFIGTMWHLSPYFIIFTCLMMLASATAEYLVNSMDSDVLTTNLKDTAARLVRMKKMRLRQTLIGISVLILIWIPWGVYEFGQHLDAEVYQPMMIGGAVGLVIGACVGIGILVKMQRANDEMIRQIREFTK